ncbi:aspartyl/asparaginyl beta-hydroxylase domain-containing protein [Mesorhizobium temperatum]|nr:aspartyl/asparaginyl beta-hydroxylase domain-containing protein [Mesorhizobium temperatum]
MTTALQSGNAFRPIAHELEPILQVLAERGAGREGHGRGTVLGHLTGTYDVLIGWGQPERVCLAGLLHNAYSTDAFAGAMFRPSERNVVRGLIGAEAEQLVHQFGGLSRDELFQTLGSGPPSGRQTLSLPDRRGGPALKLSSHDIGDLLVIYLANVADQACMSDAGPTYWLASASQLAVLAARRAEVVPPVLDHCRATVSTDAEEVGLEAYDTALRFVARDRAAAVEWLELASRYLPWVGEPLIWLGALYLVAGEAAAARIAAAEGAMLMQKWGTPWDKRLKLSEWVGLAECLASRRNEGPTLATALDAVTASPRDLVLALANLATPDAAARYNIGADKPALPPRFRAYLARQASDSETRVGVSMYPGLTARPWHSAERFPIACALENSARAIALEFAALRPELFCDEAEDIARTGRWSVLFLEKNGVRRDEVCNLCPTTAAVLETHRQEIGGAGVAYFSCLDPGTRIAPHRGATNTRLRLHLGLEVPTECGMSVGGVDGHWQEGRCAVFDDSFIHSVWNDSARRRVVLIVDLWHPDLTPHEVAVLQWIGG